MIKGPDRSATDGKQSRYPWNQRRRSWPAISLWLMALVIGVILIARATFTADLSAFLPRNPTPEQALLVEQLKDGMVSRLILMGIEGGSPESHAALSKALAKSLRADQTFISLNNGEPVNQEKDQAYLFENRYLLSPTVTPERFTVEGLHSALTDTLDLLASPAGIFARNMLSHDPTGEMVELVSQFNAGRQPKKFHGVWVSKDGSRALLLAQTRALGSDTDGQEHAISIIRKNFDLARQEVLKDMPQAKDASILLTGPGVFGVNARNTIVEESSRLAIISSILTMILLLAIYRSVTTLLLGLTPVLSGIIAGIAAVSLGFDVVHAVTIGFGTTLVGEAVDYSIYLFIQSRQGGDPQLWVRQFWPTIQIGALTSIVGFASLLFSGFPGLAQLGLYSIAGLLAAMGVTRFVLPSLLPKDFSVRDVSHIGKAAQKAIEQAPRFRAVVLICSVAAIAVLLSKQDSLWHSDLNALSPVGSADQQLDADLRRDIGAPDVRYMVVVKADDVEGVLQGAEKISQYLQQLVEKGTLNAFESPSRYLPSIESQQKRLASLPSGQELEERLAQASEGLPFKEELMKPFIESVGQLGRLASDPTYLEKRLLRPESLKGTSMELATDSLLIKNEDGATGLMPLTAPDNHVLDRASLLAAIKQAGVEQAFFLDLKTEADKLYRGYLHEAITLTLCGMLAIILLLAAYLRSIRRLARIIVPLVAAVLVAAALLAVAGQRMTILHLIGLLLIVAVGSNYALFFDQYAAQTNTRNDESYGTVSGAIDANTWASLVLANVTTVIGFGMLGFSSVPVLNAVGQTVGPGAVLALLFSAVLSKRIEPELNSSNESCTLKP